MKKKMNAAVFGEFGGPDVLRLAEVERPEAQPGHVLVRVLAAGVNRLEHYIRAGEYLRDLPLPHVLGSDASGEVAAVGEGVSGFEVGDRVIPMPGYPLDERDAGFEPMCAAPSYAVAGVRAWGTYAQYVSVPARWVVKDTTGLAPELVATLPMVLVTAVRAVKVVGGVAEGDRVLVHSGASGTGSMSIQVARALGARVAATVGSPEKAELARSLGAELVVEGRGADFVRPALEWTGGRGVDVVVDNLGGAVLTRSLAALRTEGAAVALGFVAGVDVTFDVRELFFAQKSIRGTLMGTDADLVWGLEQVRAGRIRPLLDAAFPLAKASEAHRVLAESRVVGNVVLRPWE